MVIFRSIDGVFIGMLLLFIVGSIYFGILKQILRAENPITKIIGSIVFSLIYITLFLAKIFSGGGSVADFILYCFTGR